MHTLIRHLFCALLCWLLSPALQAQTIAPTENTFQVLCYHNVLDNPLDDPERFTVSTAELVQHFSWLKRQGYHVISVNDLLTARAEKRPLPQKAILITFDDGYRSFYTHVFPLLKQFDYPATLALVGSWLQLKPGEKAPYDDHNYTRDSFLSLDEIREMAASGLVEIASHSHDLHHGILANPQGNLLPAAITHGYDAAANRYESDDAYLTRIRADLTQNSLFIQSITGKSPRVMVWPYGRYNRATLDIAQSLDMPLTFTLDEGVNSPDDSLQQVKRILLGFNTSIADLSDALALQSNPKPERIIHVDLDYIYDHNPTQQEENLGRLLDRVKTMKISTVYLQAFADPDGNGAANSVYFPNRHLPMRADLFNRVAWQLRSRAGVKVFAWMPLLAFELPKEHPLAQHRVQSSLPNKKNPGYPRLSPFDAEARHLIGEIYQDLAKHAIFDGILFHDDATLDDYEDASPWALDHYHTAWDLPASVEKIRNDNALLNKWTQHKSAFLTDFSLELAQIVRQYQPQAKTARNIYAEVIMNPDAEQWFAQSLPDFLQHYDYTAIMAMPFMENAPRPLPWLGSLVDKVAHQAQGLQKSVFELQSVDWRHANQPVDSDLLAKQMRLLQTKGALNFGYYPDDFLHDVPVAAVIRPVFSLQDFPFSGRTK